MPDAGGLMALLQEDDYSTAVDVADPYHENYCGLQSYAFAPSHIDKQEREVPPPVDERVKRLSGILCARYRVSTEQQVRNHQEAIRNVARRRMDVVRRDEYIRRQGGIETSDSVEVLEKREWQRLYRGPVAIY